MLVLSRKKNETIVFPALGIEFKVVAIKGKYVRLSITAPLSAKIMRGELVASIPKEGGSNGSDSGC